jgi:hypothetical protein
MKWSPPRIERRSFAAVISLWPAAIIVLSLSAGCISMPVITTVARQPGNATESPPAYSAEERRLLAAMPRIPQFDLPEPSTRSGSQRSIVAEQRDNNVHTPNAAELLARNSHVTAKSDATAKIHSESTRVSEKVTPEPAQSDSLQNRSGLAVNSSSPARKHQTPAETRPIEKSGPLIASRKDGSTFPSQPGVTKVQIPPITAPKPFAWKSEGRTAGGRSFQIVSVGDDGYRTLVVGSVGGNDPVALELVDQLARRLHRDSVILGGVNCTIVRSLNPDGEVNQSFLNDKGQYINYGFPKNGTASPNQPAEVTWMLKTLQDLQPQRIVHIRTVEGISGVIASSTTCRSVAKEAADWLQFRLIMLPEGARDAGSLERYVSTTGNSEIITVGIPDKTPRGEVWERYGDAILNLLIGDDAATRELARKQQQQSSADRRNQAPEK